MERIFVQPTPEEIEARRKMYEDAEKQGVDLMAFDEAQISQDSILKQDLKININ